MRLTAAKITFAAALFALGCAAYAQDKADIARDIKKIEHKLKVNKAMKCGHFALSAQDRRDFVELLTKLSEQKELLTLLDTTWRLNDTFVPAKLVQYGSFKLTPGTAENFKKMKEAAAKDKVNINVVSGYRTFGYQAGLFQRSKSRNGEEHAKRYVALPGFSQHHLGTAVDINMASPAFERTQAFKWLQENISKYGFSLSYPKGEEDKTGYAYEPWHYRYIGVEAAQMQDRFFGGDQYDMLEFLHLCVFYPKNGQTVPNKKLLYLADTNPKQDNSTKL